MVLQSEIFQKPLTGLECTCAPFFKTLLNSLKRCKTEDCKVWLQLAGRCGCYALEFADAAVRSLVPHASLAGDHASANARFEAAPDFDPILYF